MTTREHDDDRVAQYVAGTLPPDDVEDFEQHLLACSSCRDMVRIGAATRSALVASDAHPRRRRVLQFAWLPAAAVIVLAVLATRRESRWNALGSVQAAPFAGAPLRPSVDSTTALVDSGMRAYQAADFAEATAKLRRAARADSSPALRFFLGVSLLMRNDAAAAIQALRDIPVASPYAHEAAYYAAKAWVRLQRPDSAIAVIERMSAGLPVPKALQAFADSLRSR